MELYAVHMAAVSAHVNRDLRSSGDSWSGTSRNGARVLVDRIAYRDRNVIERMFCRLKDFRRIATRYDKRADTFLSAVLIAATLIWWLN